MSVLLQISDPHFGTEQPAVVEALVVLARQQRPDLLVLSGDITQRARPAQFRAARAFMDRLGAPMLAVPGRQVYWFQKYLEGKLEAVPPDRR